MSDDLVAGKAPLVLAVAAFDEFYREQYVAVWRIAAAITGSRDVGAEVAQEAFIVAQRRWRVVGNYDRPDLWVRRVAINRSLNWKRRAGNEAKALARLASRRDRHTAPPASDHASLWRFVGRLPRQQAGMVALVYVDDLSVEQAAAALDIAVPTAKTHLQRAKRTLARWLNEENDNDR